MKRIKRISKILFAFVLAVLSISIVKAAGVTVSTNSLTIRQGGSTSFTVSADYAAGRVDIISSNPNVATVSSAKVWLDSYGSGSAAITVNGIAQGSAVISVMLTDVSDYDGNIMTGTYTIPVSVTVPSTNSALSSLSVSNCSINFSPGVTDYDCGDLTAFGSVRINAVAQDSKSSISGAGTRNLSYGNRTLSVTVTAESGARTVYNIRYRRDDNRSSVATLSNLSVVGYDIGFQSDSSGPYTVTVPYKVDSVTIEGTATDPNTSSVAGLGTFALPVVGENRFEISVTAENGDVITYVVIVMRSDVENIPSTNLVNLRVNDSLVDLTGNGKTFLVGVDNNINELELFYETVSNTTTYQVTGNENLKDGINIVTIKVSDIGENTNTYVLIVNKAASNSSIVTNLKSIKDLNKDVTYNTLRYQNPVIDEDIIKLINSSNSNLIYNVTNENKGLLYSIAFNKNAGLSGALEPYFSRVSDTELTYATNIPANCHVKLYANNNFENNQDVKVYSFDEKKQKYTLVTTAKVSDYYIEFDTNGAERYVFSVKELKDPKSGLQFNLFTIILLILVVLCLGFIVLLVMKNKKLAVNGPVINPSLDSKIDINGKEVKGIGTNKKDKEIVSKKEEDIVPDFKPIEPTKGLYATMDSKVSIDNNNPFMEKNTVKEESKPLEPINTVDIKPVIDNKDLISKDINKYSSLEAEIKKNMLEEEKEKPLNPLKTSDEDRLSSYTIDLTSIDEEIKRHQFEEEVLNKARGIDNKINKKNIDTKKNNEDAFELTTIEDEIARYEKETKSSYDDDKVKSTDEIDDFFKKKDKDMVKVIDSKPYPNSKSSKPRKLSDTAILPIIDENYEAKKRRYKEQDDF